MLKRHLFLGYSDGEISLKNNSSATYIAASRYNNTIILYAESDSESFLPEEAVTADMIAFPDGRLWVSLPIVFYYNLPEDADEWVRNKPSEPRFQVSWLKDEAVSQYVFYHYQLQEENRIRKSRYYIIALFGNMLVSYDENPSFSAKPRKGCLDTNNTPNSDWKMRMDECFLKKWEVAENIFRADALWNRL